MGNGRAQSGVLRLCVGCRGHTHGNWCFLFNSFIRELEAGARSMVMKGADGAKLGGVANNSSVCDAERLAEAGKSGTIG